MSTTRTPNSLDFHACHALADGPRLLVLGAVHGNEVCGTYAIRRVMQEIEGGQLSLARGALTLVPITNALAFQRVQRNGERNLNRGLRVREVPADFEDRIGNRLCPLIAAHDVLLDLHSFNATGEPFAVVGPTDNDGPLEPFAHAAAEGRLAAHLGPRRVVTGWMSAYERGVKRRRAAPAGYSPTLLDVDYGVGTTEFMRRSGGYAVTLECGQHADPAAPARAYRAIRQTLALLGMADIELEPPAADFEVLALEDVTDRHDAQDAFTRPWSSFDAVEKDQVIGVRRDGSEVRAPAAGRVVFPNTNALPGNEWFYFARNSARRLL
ncbi:MAG: succinylglutamate desuccinylase/aspartoacylase family protein [Burkholderiales bacterium]|nr:succinylglutamate desuccinylase/aspartoacylase family protein [Burkholderiales bacterium]